MRFQLLPLAASLVRAWTRAYTRGLPAAEQRARRAEVESDLWEFQHDAHAPRAAWGAMHVLARLAAGIPDDLAWRIDAGVTARRAPVTALAAAGVMTSPRRVSAFGLAATIHVVALSAATWMASGATPDSDPGLRHAGIGSRRAALVASFWNPQVSLVNQRGRYARPSAAVVAMAVQRAPSPPATRPFAVIRNAAAALAARVGLTSASTAAARAPASADGLSASSPASANRTPVQSLATRWKAGVAAMVGAVAIGVGPRAGLLGAPHTAEQPQPPPLDRFIARLLQNRYSLALQNGQFSGSGAYVLHSAIGHSHFVLLGENHGLAQTPEFGAALCNATGADRFHAMAIEESPSAAADLESWARRPDGLAQLTAFEKTFPDYALSIYGSREEFEMLQYCDRAAQGALHLWGLNHEALGAAGPILSRMLDKRLGEAARSAVQQLRQKNDDAYSRARQTGNFMDLFMMSADDHDLALATAALEHDGSPEARSLFASFVESHEINRRSPVDYDILRRRERLMKTRFADAYTKAASAAAAPPKVLLKFGAYHIYRGLNPAHSTGIGNYVAEFAEAHGVQSLHIRVLPVQGSAPIHPRVGQPSELRPFSFDTERGARALEPVVNNRLESAWTLFDLRPLRRDFNALAGAASPDLATLVFGIDLLVVVSNGTPATDIR